MIVIGEDLIDHVGANAGGMMKLSVDVALERDK